jgi:dTDP-4-dehydrorhamnose reductase
VTAASRQDLDVTDPAAVEAAVDGHDVVVNCAAWTDVDGAEEHEDEAARVNVDAPRHLAAACAASGGLLVHLSTDYVFGSPPDAQGGAPEPWTEDAPMTPLSAYGRTKAAGEDAVRSTLPDRHLVVRTAWLYGAHGRCFPRTMAGLAADRDRLTVVDDQVGQPTWTVDVADLLVRLVEAGATGTFHATSSGRTSWFEFAREVVAAAGRPAEMVVPVSSAEFVRPAPRPSFSVLGHDALAFAGIEPIGDWRDRWRAAAPTVLGASGVVDGVSPRS